MRPSSTSLRGLQPFRNVCGLLAGLIMTWAVVGEGLARAEKQGGEAPLGLEQGTGD